jgi:hypothetical protein
MAIPGYPPNTTYRTIIWNEYEVFMCAAQAGCTKGLGWRAHWFGRVDRAGTIHWKQADRRASRRGMRVLMKLMAMVIHREWWTEPKWRQLYLTNVWATKEVRTRFHYMVRARWSYEDRKLALRLARTAGIRKTGSLRWSHRGFYKWVLDAGLLQHNEVQSLHQEGDPPVV